MASRIRILDFLPEIFKTKTNAQFLAATLDQLVAQPNIKRIQGYTIIIDKDSPNVKKALSNYSWHDKKSGVPNHNWSDLMDSMRYAVSELLRD